MECRDVRCRDIARRRSRLDHSNPPPLANAEAFAWSDRSVTSAAPGTTGTPRRLRRTRCEVSAGPRPRNAREHRPSTSRLADPHESCRLHRSASCSSFAPPRCHPLGTRTSRLLAGVGWKISSLLLPLTTSTEVPVAGSHIKALAAAFSTERRSVRRDDHEQVLQHGNFVAVPRPRDVETSLVRGYVKHALEQAPKARLRARYRPSGARCAPSVVARSFSNQCPREGPTRSRFAMQRVVR